MKKYTVVVYNADGKCVERAFQTDDGTTAETRAERKREEYARLGWRVTVKIETE